MTMLFSSLQMQFGGLAAAALAMCAAGIFIWLLIRRRMRTIRLPTLRVLEFTGKKLPKIVLVRPPLIPFLCFALSCLMFAFFALRPKRIVNDERQAKRLKTVMVVDLSPSVSALIDIEAYRALVRSWAGKVQERSDLLVATSLDGKVVTLSSPEELEPLLAGMDFHREGLRLSSLLRKITESASDLDRYVIFSDHDRHSWDGFNWQYLTDQGQVFLVDLQGRKQQASNLFVHGVESVERQSGDSSGKTGLAWDVVLARSGAESAIGGELVLSAGETKLAEERFQFHPDAERITVRLQAEADQLPSLAKPEARLLSLSINPEGGDSIVLDNQARFPLNFSRKRVLVVGGLQGEQFLKDPSYDLQTTLKILGFEIARVDVQPAPSALSAHDFIVYLPDASFDDAARPGSSCDLLAGRSPRNAADQSLASAAAQAQGRRAKIWLAPSEIGQDYDALCRCVARFVNAKQDADHAMCKEIKTPDEFAGILRSLGAKQVGGALGQTESSAAWSFGKEMLQAADGLMVFSLPLRTHPKGVFSNATLPVLIRELLIYDRLLRAESLTGEAGKSSFADLATQDRLSPEKPASDVMSDAADSSEISAADAASARESETTPAGNLAKDQGARMNVPLAESLLMERDAQSFPPSLFLDVSLEEVEKISKVDRELVLPIAQWLVLLSAIILLFEGFYHLYRRFFVAPSLQRTLLLPLLFGASMLGWNSRAEAQIALVTLDYPLRQEPLATLASEVQGRTSIEFSEKALLLQSGNQEVLRQPWIWIQNVASVSDTSGKLKPEFGLWLKRGGLLVVDGYRNLAELEAMTKPLSQAQPRSSAWLPIPPDHEIMRSFYLLDNVPMCRSLAWHGFQFDGRIAVLAIPFHFLKVLTEESSMRAQCGLEDQDEMQDRIFINIVMVSLATDYKKDQIHLPEILKRLRL